MTHLERRHLRDTEITKRNAVDGARNETMEKERERKTATFEKYRRNVRAMPAPRERREITRNDVTAANDSPAPDETIKNSQ